MDANVKLSQWGFLVQGCVDGYSRAVIYLNCAACNSAALTLEYFARGMSHFGLPSRTRSDARLENVVVSRLMVDLQGRAKAVVLLEGQFITREFKGCGEMVILWY